MTALLVAEGIALSFPDRNGTPFTVLAFDRFAPEPGRITAVVGASGSGKSTLLYVVAGLLPPGRGRVVHGDADLYALREGRRDAWRRRNVGFVFQDFHLIPELSVTANAALPATFGKGRGVRERTTAALAALNVPTGRRSVEELSRGERQRVAIARALAFDPPLILADEPTASLDAAAAGDVRTILRRLADDGRTVVVVTHDPVVVDAADAVFRLEHGRIAATPRIAA